MEFTAFIAQFSLFMTLIAIGGALIALYFLPAIIAGRRGTKNQGMIFAINALIGWSIVGWLAVFIWAVVERADEQAPPEIVAAG